MNDNIFGIARRFAVALVFVASAYAGFAQDPIMAINFYTGLSYTSMIQAVAEAEAGNSILAVSDVRIEDDLVLDGSCTIELNGHYLEPVWGGELYTVTLNGDALDNSNSSMMGTVYCDIIANVSVNFAAHRIAAYSVVLGAADVEVVSQAAISYCSSFSEAYVVEETIRDDGCHVYALVDNPDYVPAPVVPTLPSVPVVTAPAPTLPTLPAMPTVGAPAVPTTTASGSGATQTLSAEAKLLGCSAESELPTARAAFKITSVEKVDGKWEVKVTGGKGHGDRYANGYVRIREVTIPGASASAVFFKAELVADASAD